MAKKDKQKDPGLDALSRHVTALENLLRDDIMPQFDIIQKSIAELKEASGGAVNPNPNPVEPTDPDPGEGGSGTGYTLTRGFSLRPTALTGTVATAGRYWFEITDLALRTTGNGGVVTNANGHDIRIEDGAASVPYRRVSYNATTGTLIGWVRIPSGVGSDGVVLTLKAGKSGDTDQADPAGTFATYGYAYGADGTDYSGNGRNLVLGTGVTAGTGDKIAFDGQGGVATYTGDLGFLRQATIGMYAHIEADASYYGSNRGFMINLGEGSGASFLWRNNQSFGDVTNVFRAGGWRQGAWGEAAMPAASAIGGDPVGVCVNYLPAAAPQIGIAGEFQTPSSSTPHASSGTMDTFGSVLTFGKGSTEGAGVSLLGSMGPLHCRPWAYGEAEKLLLDRQLAGWNAIQMADADGNYVALADPPVLSNGPVPTAPTANPDSASTAFQTLVNIPVLANDTAGTDPIDPTTVTIVGSATKGTAVAQSNGTVNYTPGTGESGTGTFSYTVDDTAGRTSNTALVTINIAASGGGGGGGNPLVLPPVTGITRNVSNGSQLDSALAAANPGDHIVLANGSYGGVRSFSRDGTAGAPIVVRAANLLQATTGGIAINGSHQIVHGIVQTSTGISMGFSRLSQFSRYWRCRFTGVSNAASTAPLIRGYNAPDAEIAYCELTAHSGLYIVMNNVSGSVRPIIRRCWFHDQPNYPGNTTEGIMLGFGGASPSAAAGTTMAALIEFNLFQNMRNDPEIISVKSNGNIIRRNTCINTNWISNRVGDRNLYEANYFNGANGIDNFDGIPGGNTAVTPGPNGVLYLGNVQVNSSVASRLYMGTHQAGDRLGSSNYCASRGIVFSGNSLSGGLTIGSRYSSGTWPFPANSVRIRQHSGGVSQINGPINMDIQTGVSEGSYSWVSTVPLTSANVGPTADL